MLVLITYDVNTVEKEGRSRLRKVAKICVNYGQRVQNSVFECDIDPAMYVDIKNKLSKIIDHSKDSLRFYRIGSNWTNKIEMIGNNDTYDSKKDIFLI